MDVDAIEIATSELQSGDSRGISHAAERDIIEDSVSGFVEWPVVLLISSPDKAYLCEELRKDNIPDGRLLVFLCPHEGDDEQYPHQPTTVVETLVDHQNSSCSQGGNGRSREAFQLYQTKINTVVIRDARAVINRQGVHAMGVGIIVDPLNASGSHGEAASSKQIIERYQFCLHSVAGKIRESSPTLDHLTGVDNLSRGKELNHYELLKVRRNLTYVALVLGDLDELYPKPEILHVKARKLEEKYGKAITTEKMRRKMTIVALGIAALGLVIMSPGRGSFDRSLAPALLSAKCAFDMIEASWKAKVDELGKKRDRAATIRDLAFWCKNLMKEVQPFSSKIKRIADNEMSNEGDECGDAAEKEQNFMKEAARDAKKIKEEIEKAETLAAKAAGDASLVEILEDLVEIGDDHPKTSTLVGFIRSLFY